MDLLHSNIQDQQIRENFEALAAAIGQPTFRRLAIPTEESTTSAAFTTLTTPDLVKSVPMPTGGYIAVGYQAMWKESVQGAARANIFLNSNEVLIAPAAGAAGGPLASAARINGAAASALNQYKVLASCPRGLSSLTNGASAGAYTGDVTTGQVLGGGLVFDSGAVDQTYDAGVVYIFAAAGFYDVSIKFSTTSGTVTAKERKLAVWTVGATSGQSA